MKNGTIGTQELSANFVGTGEGKGKLWNGTAVVDALNQDALYKSEKVTVTFDNPGQTTMQSYAGYYEVKVKSSANDLIRIANVPNSWTKSSYVGAYEAQTEVSIGYLHVKANGSFEYFAAGATTGAEAGNLEFIFSVSSDNESGLETKTVGATYGTIVITFGNVASALPTV